MARYGRLCILLFLVHVSLVCCDDDEKKNILEDDFLGGFDFEKLLKIKCEFKCKNGAKPKPNKKFKHKEKNCAKLGSQYSFLDDLPDVTSCCDQLQMCYEDCGIQKIECDQPFRECLQQMCSNKFEDPADEVVNACTQTTKLMYTSVLALGCEAYFEGQKKGCSCKRMTKEEL